MGEGHHEKQKLQQQTSATPGRRERDLEERAESIVAGIGEDELGIEAQFERAVVGDGLRTPCIVFSRPNAVGGGLL